MYNEYSRIKDAVSESTPTISSTRSGTNHRRLFAVVARAGECERFVVAVGVDRVVTPEIPPVHVLTAPRTFGGRRGEGGGGR